MKRDRARTKILRTSPFGLIEMTRQRIRPSLRKSIFRDCPTCTGTGTVKTAESMAIEVMRTLHLSESRDDVTRLTVTVHDEVATWINNRKRREITQFEDRTHIQLHVVGKDGVSPEHLVFDAWDTGGRSIRFP
jgi:ribonuclease E